MYQWVVFAHVLGVFGFLLAHGASVAVAFRLRGERDIERMRALLDLSGGMRAFSYASLLVLLVAGIALGFMGGWWGQHWIWAALGLLVLLSAAMGRLGTRPFMRLRQLIQPGEWPRGKAAIQSSVDAVSDQQLAALLAAIHPVLLTVIGGGGLAIVLWLMLFKPF